MAAEPSVPAARPVPRFVHLHANPMTASIGAEIEGVDLNAPLSEDVQEELRTALHHFHVIAFRDQFLDDDGHLARTAAAADCRWSLPLIAVAALCT